MSSERRSHLIKIIEYGLKLWIKQKFKSIENIRLEINGPIFRILRGNVSSLNLSAERINLDDLIINQAVITTSPIRIILNISGDKEKIQLKESFHIKGNVSIQAEDIQQAITSPRWSWLGEWLSENLLGGKSIEKISIIKNHLCLSTINPITNIIEVNKFTINPIREGLLIKAKDSEVKSVLPVEEAIQIATITIGNHYINIEGTSLIKP